MIKFRGHFYREAGTSFLEDLYFLLDPLAPWDVYQPYADTLILSKEVPSNSAYLLVRDVKISVEGNRKKYGLHLGVPSNRGWIWSGIMGGSVEVYLDDAHDYVVSVVVTIRE